MKVIALTTDAFGGYGGIAQYNRDFLGGLVATNHFTDVQVFVRHADTVNFDVPDRVTQHPPTQNKYLYAANALLQSIKLRPDLIFCGHLFHGPLAILLSRLTGAPVVSQLHGTEIWSRIRTAHLRPLEKSKLVLCVSEHTREKYLEQSREGTNNAEVLWNTVSDEFNPKAREAAREHFGLNGEFVVLSVGRLDSRQGGYKGHDKVMKSICDLERNISRPVKYIIAGTGDDSERLMQLCNELKLHEKVRFLGKVNYAELVKLYKSADIFALPSSGEGFGIVYLEAMASGVPAIGLSVGGAVDALKGLGIAATEVNFKSQFSSAARMASEMDRTDRESLSKRTKNRFGRPAFQRRLRKILSNHVFPDLASQ